MFLADQQYAYVKTCVCVCVCEQQLVGLNFCEGLFSGFPATSMSKYLRDSFFRSNAYASFIRKRKTIQGPGVPGLQQKT
jgi:hypothetical protein